MLDYITITIPKPIRRIFKQWARDYREGERQLATTCYRKTANCLDACATAPGPIRVETEFLFGLMLSVVGLLHQDFSSISDARRRLASLDLQNEARVVVPWISDLLGINLITQFSDDAGEMPVVA